MTQTLYDRLGGAPAIQGALDHFYGKVLADPQLSVLFDGLNVDRIKEHQAAFLAMAFGGPNDYQGRDLRTAHKSAVDKGMDERLFDRFMGHFEVTLQELGAPQPEIDEVMAIANGGKDEVLNR